MITKSYLYQPSEHFLIQTFCDKLCDERFEEIHCAHKNTYIVSWIIFLCLKGEGSPTIQCVCDTVYFV